MLDYNSPLISFMYTSHCTGSPVTFPTYFWFIFLDIEFHGKGLLKGLEDLEVGGRAETIQTTTLLKTDRILRRVLENEETCCHSNSSERPSANADVKNSNE